MAKKKADKMLENLFKWMKQVHAPTNFKLNPLYLNKD